MRGRSTLNKRLTSGLKFKTRSENIGMVHWYQVDSKRFQIVNASQCKLQLSNGQPLPAHSDAILVRHIVDLWMNSPVHRKKTLDHSAKRVSDRRRV